MNFQEIRTELRKLNITPQILGTNFDFLEQEDEENLMMDGELVKIEYNYCLIKNKIQERLGPFSKVLNERINDSEISIFYFEAHDVYIKMDGWYSSYEGTSFEEDFIECRPKEKIITVYE